MQRKQTNQFRVGFLIVTAMVAILPAVTRADGWEAIPTQELIARSRYIGIGKLAINGKTDDGWLKGKLYFTQQIYSAIGQTKEYAVRIAPATVPGKAQNWPSGKSGIWFILKDGDSFEPVNHPACWMDESEAKAIANAVYGAANKAYSEAKQAAKQSTTTSSSSGDGSNSDKSIAAYAAMAAAAETARNVPFQDKTQQSQQFYDQVMQMLQTAGIKPPFGDLTTPAQQNAFFDHAKELFGPAGTAMGQLPGQGDPSRAGHIASAENNVGSLYLELIKNTMGSKNPAESLQKMGPIPLDLPGGKGAPAGGPPGLPFPGGEKGGKPPEFQMPKSQLADMPAGGSRQQMLSSLIDRKPAGGGTPSAGPKIGGPGATPGPKGPAGPGGPGGGPRPGPR